MTNLNPQKEDYLITIFKLMGEGEKVTNKSISTHLNLAPPSVTEMLKKLKKEGLVTDDKENQLTEEGIKVTKKLLSKHRLWEYFLENELGFSWKDIHPIANDLQSVTNDDLLDKLNAYLGYPDYCPHGSIIFINNEETPKDLLKMSEAIPGKAYIIRRIRDDKDLLTYCESMGINIADKIQFIDFDNFDKTAIIRIDSIEKRISPKACGDIYLKEV
ncbi:MULTISPECIES: metal-dependent transcriptional regulator [unclassified Anaerococcus]|uniref:metal-dependent transcriptional regulator n=1 Tax=unclassified Anaerococcus TaxID=2614126 RepID=UPI0021C66F9F|nr:metal-dependent transcriptional regulator [Anaerococcus sp. Marseille-Q5996]